MTGVKAIRYEMPCQIQSCLQNVYACGCPTDVFDNEKGSSMAVLPASLAPERKRHSWVIPRSLSGAGVVYSQKNGTTNQLINSTTAETAFLLSKEDGNISINKGWLIEFHILCRHDISCVRCQCNSWNPNQEVELYEQSSCVAYLSVNGLETKQNKCKCQTSFGSKIRFYENYMSQVLF